MGHYYTQPDLADTFKGIKTRIVAQETDTYVWTPLVLAPGITGVTSTTPAALTLGHFTLLRGTLLNNTGGTLAPLAIWATIAAVNRAQRPLWLTMNYYNTSTYNFTVALVAADGTIGLNSTSVISGGTLQLDGISYPMV